MGYPRWFTDRELSPAQRRLLGATGFLMRLSLLSLPMFLITLSGASLWALQVVVASQSSALLQALGYQAVRDGALVTVNSGFAFFIDSECTGLRGMLLLFALVFAVSGVGLRERLAGLALGLPAVWSANLARIAGVVGARGIWGTGAAVLVHDWVFQIMLAIAVLSVWGAWLLWARARAS